MQSMGKSSYSPSFSWNDSLRSIVLQSHFRKQKENESGAFSQLLTNKIWWKDFKCWWYGHLNLTTMFNFIITEMNTRILMQSQFSGLWSVKAFKWQPNVVEDGMIRLSYSAYVVFFCSPEPKNCLCPTAQPFSSCIPRK